jgi:hypothetical protein
MLFRKASEWTAGTNTGSDRLLSVISTAVAVSVNICVTSTIAKPRTAVAHPGVAKLVNKRKVAATLATRRARLPMASDPTSSLTNNRSANTAMALSPCVISETKLILDFPA